METTFHLTDADSGAAVADGVTVFDSRRGWPLERVLFALAGTMTLVAAGLAATLSPWFLLLTAFVGVNQWLYVTVGACPASVVLRRACHLRSAMDDARGPIGEAKV